MLHSAIWTGRKFWHTGKRFTTSTGTVFIALGSNLGNRANNIHKALKTLEEHVKISRTSFLYESKPMYKTDQPSFLNAALQGYTKLPPHELLRQLKSIESRLGRDENQVRYGPRPIDVDILTYGTQHINDATLTIPHPRIHEREFVLQPLYDIQPSLCIADTTVEESLQRLRNNTKPELSRVTPTSSGRLLKWGERTFLMGIINATPDSFSDGGMHNTIESAMDQVSRFLDCGFDMIDIGGQSTRPGAEPVGREEELMRILPIIESIVKAHPDVIISCDTNDSIVATRALAAGADVVNDVTAGRDPGMFGSVSDSGAGMVMMHMRGNPMTMQGMVDYNEVVKDVSVEIADRIEAGMDNGIPRWSIMADPGIGFAKTGTQSTELIRNMRKLKKRIGGYPTVLGLSRKSFMCRDEDSRCTRDWKTAGAVGAAVAGGGVDMVRLHSAEVGYAVWASDLVSRSD